MGNTKQTKHTPGPWTLSKTDDYVIEAVKAGSPYEVCTYMVDSDNEAEDLANARLIAAAPDLLDVVQLIIKEWEKPTEGVQVGELIARLSQYSVEARAAIAKATGGTK